MIIVQIPKDIKKIEKKALFGLTVRQLICLSIGGVLGVILYFLTKALFHNSTISIFFLIGSAIPVFFVGMFERDGFRVEQLIKFSLEKKIRPSERAYKAEYIKEIREVVEA